ncbi:MAG: HutD family protein [Alphaproteobacteria bacterium]|nr:MAG: HutD family protein [Alphaproteobacteria bacterium]
MSFHHLTAADYRAMPWKNGQGSTTEILSVPTDEGDGFKWRISIADVTADGPFSKFPHVDRTIMLIEGKGMVLDAGEAGTLDLSHPFTPVPFEGDWPVYGRLLGGPVKDFNVMSDRRYARTDVAVMTLGAVPQPVALKGAPIAVHLFGPASLQWPDGRFVAARTGDTLVFDKGTNCLLAATGPAAVQAAVVAVRLLA